MSMKVGVAIPTNMLEDIEDLMRTLGYKSRSKLIQDAVRHYITFTAWRKGSGSVVGALAVLYDHEVKGADEQLTDIQHDFLNVIISALHAHLTKNYCLQLILVRGDVSDIKELYLKLNSVKGVIQVTPIIMKV